MPSTAELDWLEVSPTVTLRLVRAQAATRSPRAVVVLLHGRSEFVEKYTETLAELTARGLEVWTFDWRGQGLSSRPLANRHKGDAGAQGFEGYLSDLRAILLHCSNRWPHSADLPRVLLTHSMGGHVALRYQATHPGHVTAAVHLAPMLGVRLPVSARLLGPALSLLARTPLAGTFVAERERTAERMLPFEHNVLTSDRARYEHLREVLRRHPRLAVGGPTLAWLADALRSCSTLPALAPRITEPTRFVVATADRVVENDAIRAFAAAVPNATLTELEGAEHEILLERDALRARFFQTFDAFLDQVLAGRQPPLDVDRAVHHSI